MKKKTTKKVVVKQAVKKAPKTKLWLWILIGFVIGAGFGYTTHYTIANWNKIFGEQMKCDDGQRPDKNGCCAGEVYTDAGGGWMVCCPNGGDNCFPPIK